MYSPSTSQHMIDVIDALWLVADAKIYNIDTKEYDVVKWNELENVQYFYNFFKKHEQEFL